jgi:hypothetical protein
MLSFPDERVNVTNRSLMTTMSHGHAALFNQCSPDSSAIKTIETRYAPLAYLERRPVQRGFCSLNLEMQCPRCPVTPTARKNAAINPRRKPLDGKAADRRMARTGIRPLHRKHFRYMNVAIAIQLALLASSRASNGGRVTAWLCHLANSH